MFIISNWLVIMIGLGGLILLISHLFVILVLVLWVELK
jgi:hypothetical protein